jgi:ABC-type Fe3+ transport system permease subunit
VPLIREARWNGLRQTGWRVFHAMSSTLAIGIVASVIAVRVWLTLGAIHRRIKGH